MRRAFSCFELTTCCGDEELGQVKDLLTSQSKCHDKGLTPRQVTGMHTSPGYTQSLSGAFGVRQGCEGQQRGGLPWPVGVTTPPPGSKGFLELDVRQVALKTHRVGHVDSSPARRGQKEQAPGSEGWQQGCEQAHGSGGR